MKSSDISTQQLSFHQIQSSIFENTLDGVIFTNEKGVIFSANQAAEELLFASDKKSWLKKNIFSFLPLAQINTLQTESELLDILSSRRSHIKVIVKNLDVFEQSLKIDISKTKVKNSLAYIFILHNLNLSQNTDTYITNISEELEAKVEMRTDELNALIHQLETLNEDLQFNNEKRKHVEIQLRNKEIELRNMLKKEQELNQLKSRFISIASHELRTPMSTILASADLIGRYAQKENKEQYARHVQRIKSSIRNLTGVLDDFLSLTKLEEGKEINIPELFSLKSFIEDVFDEMSILLRPNQDIIYHSDLHADEIFLDDRILRNILINLLSNASKFSPEGGEIIVTTSIKQNKLYLTIQDFGIGIPKIEQGLVFNRFYRAQNTTKTNGSGLGLNIIQQYLSLMDGEIRFKSEVDQGSTFFISIPIPKPE